MSKIVIKNLEKSFGDNKVINNFNIDINDGEFIVLVGPSGCGKSTLLRMISGLESINQGEIFLDEKLINNLLPSKREIAMVFQSYALYPHMTVFDNMAFGLKLEKRSKEEIDERVQEAAKILQIEDYLTRKPKQLSGGQRQRVAIGRAITRKPQVFLFDEPLSNLDAALRVQMRVELAKLHEQIDATMIYVTHDQTEAMTLSDEIVVLDKGRISQQGNPLNLYNKPSNIFVASFIGSPKMNLIPAKLINQDKDNLELVLLDKKFQIKQTINKELKDENITVGLRPENLHITENDDFDWQSKAFVVENLGSNTFVYLESPNGPIIVECESDQNIKTGQLLKIKFDTNKFNLFNDHDSII